MSAALPSDSEATALQGDYYSDELQVLYRVSINNSGVILSYPRGDIVLAPFGEDRFVGPWPFGLIQFQCEPTKGCSGFVTPSFLRVTQKQRLTGIVSLRNG